MNKKMIGKLVGVLFFLEALFMLPAIAVCFVYGETGAPLRGFLWTVALLLALSLGGCAAPADAAVLCSAEAAPAGRAMAEAGTVRVDEAVLHDIYAPYIFQQFRDMGFDRVFDPERVSVMVDHLYPTCLDDDPRCFRYSRRCL